MSISTTSSKASAMVSNSYFNTIPLEIQDAVIDELPEPRDAFNLAVAFPNLANRLINSAIVNPKEAYFWAQQDLSARKFILEHGVEMCNKWLLVRCSGQKLDKNDREVRWNFDIKTGQCLTEHDLEIAKKMDKILMNALNRHLNTYHNNQEDILSCLRSCSPTCTELLALTPHLFCPNKHKHCIRQISMWFSPIDNSIIQPSADIFIKSLCPRRSSHNNFSIYNIRYSEQGCRGCRNGSISFPLNDENQMMVLEKVDISFIFPALVLREALREVKEKKDLEESFWMTKEEARKAEEKRANEAAFRAKFCRC